MSIAGNFSIRVRAAVISALMVVLAAFAGAAHTNPANGDGAAAVKRAVTVADAIEMTQFGDRSYVGNWVRSGNVVEFSPDGNKFAFLTQKGNLKNNTVEYSILVFQTADAFSSPHAEVVATLASSSNREAIRRLQWLSDNDTMVFLGEQPGETPQIYKVSVRTKKLERLTHQSTAIADYSMSQRGDTFVYVAEVGPRPAVSDDMERRGFFVTSQRWDELYTNRRPFDTRHEIYVKTARMKTPQRAGRSLDLYAPAKDLSVSPNGRYALLRAYETSPPTVWNEYRYKSDQEIGAQAACSADAPLLRCPEQFMVVDLENRTIAPLLNVPIVRKRPAGDVQAAWTRQSSVFVVNTLLPLDSVQNEDRDRRLNHVYTIEVTLPERRILKVSERQEAYPAILIESDATRDRIAIKTNIAAFGPSLEFSKEGTTWKITEISSEATKPEDRLSVTFDQDYNSPPKLVANDPKTKRKAVVLDLNPQFSQLTLGRVEMFQWKTPEGGLNEGMLYYPPDYVPGKKYPLIVQTHGGRRERFLIEGPYTTAYAAQPLANKGFMVLQMDLLNIYEKSSVDEVYRLLGTPQEGPHYTSLFESAIDELNKRGLIDRTRVGYSGFSRTTYHVLYGLVHSRYPIAAAVAADGVNFGYVSCVYFVVALNGSICDKMNGGGPPFGASLAGWGKAAPTFNLDKVKTPLLLQAISGPVVEWEILTGLRWLNKPVDLLNFYPQGVHELVRPQQRLLSQGSVVDWYCFWLKGEEDPDPTKAEQYKRWRELRKLQEQSMKKFASEWKNQ